jgi:hypothetical protein
MEIIIYTWNTKQSRGTNLVYTGNKNTMNRGRKHKCQGNKASVKEQIESKHETKMYNMWNNNTRNSGTKT